MSWYTIFDQREPTVTSTTTSILLGTDPILIASANQKHAAQSTVVSVQCQGTATLVTTTSTATNIPPYGLTVLNTTAGGASPAWTLSDPPSAGLCKTIFCISTTTSTPVTIQVNFAAATGISTDVTVNSTNGIISIGFGGAAGAGSGFGGYFELQSLSTTQWLVVGRSAANAHSS